MKRQKEYRLYDAYGKPLRELSVKREILAAILTLLLCIPYVIAFLLCVLIAAGLVDKIAMSK